MTVFKGTQRSVQQPGEAIDERVNAAALRDHTDEIFSSAPATGSRDNTAGGGTGEPGDDPLVPETFVESFSESGEALITGHVTISEGSNITLTQAGQNIEIAFGATLSATLANSATTNVNVATTAAVSKVHIEYDVTQSTYREVGALDVVVDGGNGRIANRSYSTVGSTGKVMTTLAADQDGANLRLNITIDDHAATADFKATCTLVATH